jgi:hypothetical protein
MSDLLSTARHTAAQLRTVAAALAAPGADALAIAGQLTALAGGLEVAIGRAAASSYEAHTPPPARPTGATPALSGAARLHREGVR